jgi:hypothetical protein
MIHMSQNTYVSYSCLCSLQGISQYIVEKSAQRALVRVPKSDDDIRCVVADH